MLGSLRNKRICLLIAHPDDEAMFFAPTLLALTDPAAGNHVKILCLSAGDADGLGETRKKELVKSGLFLGLRKEDDVFIVDDKKFPDSMTTPWSATDISSLLSTAFCPDDKDVSIDVLLTFDPIGVSGHVNHRSLYHGACAWIASLHRQRRGECDNRTVAGPVPALYILPSINVLRKYSFIFDLVPTLIEWAIYTVLPFFSTSSPSLGIALPEIMPSTGPADKQYEDSRREDDWEDVGRMQVQTKGRKINPMKRENLLQESPGTGCCVNSEYPARVMLASSLGPRGWGRAWSAMTEAHKSQMLWFRYGWICLSRYMVVNDLALVTLSEATSAGTIDRALGKENAS